MKRKLMLISPMLHQGGFERVCITTARLLEPYFDVTIVIFNSADIAYNIDGLHIIDIRMGAKKGKVKSPILPTALALLPIWSMLFQKQEGKRFGLGLEITRMWRKRLK